VAAIPQEEEGHSPKECLSCWCCRANEGEGNRGPGARGAAARVRYDAKPADRVWLRRWARAAPAAGNGPTIFPRHARALLGRHRSEGRGRQVRARAKYPSKKARPARRTVLLVPHALFVRWRKETRWGTPPHATAKLARLGPSGRLSPSTQCCGEIMPRRRHRSRASPHRADRWRPVPSMRRQPEFPAGDSCTVDTLWLDEMHVMVSNENAHAGCHLGRVPREPYGASGRCKSGRTSP